MLSRRTLLGSALAAGAGTLLAACTRGAGTQGAGAQGAEASATGPGLRVAGDREQLLAPGQFETYNTPDGHISFLDVDGDRRLWLSSGVPAGGGRTVALDNADPDRPRPVSGALAVAGLEPVGGTTAFDSDYSAPGSVFPAADGRSLWLVYHGENHTFAGVTGDGVPYYATIGLASSDDGGLTWRRRGAVISGQVPRDDRPAPREVVGAGVPCVLVHEGFVHVFYVDWNLSSPDEIHVARAPLDAVDDPLAWVKWHDGAFSAPGAGGASTAVVTRPADGEETVFAGGPSASWNEHLQRFVLVFQSADGFWWTHSTDLTTWDGATRFLDIDAPVLAGTSFAGYGSLLTPSAVSDQVTGRDAFLYLAIGEVEGESHSLWRIPVEVSR